MKNHDRTITLSMVVAFFTDIICMIIVWLNVNEFIGLNKNTQNSVTILGILAFVYLILVLVMIVFKIVKNGKLQIDDNEKELNRQTYNKMFAFSIMGICVILMSFYIMLDNLVLIF